jgi:hypothetical protein
MEGNPMTHFKVGLLTAIVVFASAIGANAQVLCVSASGAVWALPACKPGMTQLDVVANGLQGPAGPAGPQGPAGPVGPEGPAGTANVYLARMDYFSENRITRFNSLDLPAGTYLVAAKGTMTSAAYGFCQIVSGPDTFQTYWDSFGYDNGTTQLAVVLFARITLTDASTNVALRCGNGFGEPWNITQPVLWAMPVAP